MKQTVLVAGGGMAGLGAALACSRALPGVPVQLLEQAHAFAEVGAGMQLGPNAVRVLHDWGLQDALAECAAFPQDLTVRDAHSGSTLGRLPLAGYMSQQYGQPYATVHRADLHALLLQAVQATGQVQCLLGQRISHVEASTEQVQVYTESGWQGSTPLLLGCDGGRSRLREQLWQDGPLRFSGDLAYRALLPMADVPLALRHNRVTAWLGPRMHAVHYPVRAGQAMNVVVMVEGPWPAPAALEWDHAAHAADLRRALGSVSPDLARLLDCVSGWRLWPLNVREPMQGPSEHAQGRVALLGDAAHPTRPYLAQGAAMALEDAWALGQVLAQAGPEPWAAHVPALLQRWAAGRWQRNAWVQAKSRRNGTVFHAYGPLRWARDMAMRALGTRLLDQPFLYSGPVGRR